MILCTNLYYLKGNELVFYFLNDCKIKDASSLQVFPNLINYSHKLLLLCFRGTVRGHAGCDDLYVRVRLF